MHTFVERIYDFYVLNWKCYFSGTVASVSFQTFLILIADSIAVYIKC